MTPVSVAPGAPSAGSGAGSSADGPVFRVEHAAFGFADRTVLPDVTLQIEAGEIVAILGPNGSGKSTLVKGMLGLADHQGGEVAIFGVPLARFRAHARLGYVPQRHTLTGSVRATVWEVVSTGRLSGRHLLRPTNARDRQVVARSLELVGLSSQAHADVGQLSGGQQRRVLIARALCAEPEVLVMDEPTAGVDAQAQLGLAQVLRRLAGEGVTMLVVTHEMVAIAEVVTRVLVVEGGRIRFDGSPAQLQAAGRGDTHYLEAHHAEELARLDHRAPFGASGPLEPGDLP